jgi:methyl-accepting chemotaxis protein
MNFLDNIKTGAKLIGGFMIVVLIIVAVSVLNYFNMKSLNDGTNSLYNNGLIPVEKIEVAESTLLTIRGDALKYMLIPTQRQDILKTIADNKTVISTNLEDFKKNITNSSQDAALTDFETTLKNYYTAIDAFTAIVDKNDSESAIKSISSGGDLSNTRLAVTTSITKLIDLTVKMAEDNKNQGNTTFSTASIMLIVISLISIVIAIFMGVVITRNIAIPLVQTTQSLQKIAQGDLLRSTSNQEGNESTTSKDADLLRKLEMKTQRMLKRRDEIGDISNSLRSLIGYLQTMGNVARTIAKNDLSVAIEPKSETDELGNAFLTMV